MSTAQVRTSAGTIAFFLLVFATAPALAQSSGQVLYNGITLPQLWPPIVSPNQNYQLPSYITSPPAVIPIDLGRQLFVDDFLIQQTTLTRTQHQLVQYALNPVLAPDQEDVAGFAMPFSDGVWFDPSDQLFKMWFYCGPGNSTCYAYSSDGKNWTRPSIPDAAVPNSDQVIVAQPGQLGLTGLTVWMDLQDPNPARKFKAFASDSTPPAYLLFSPDGIHWTFTNRSQYPIPMYDRTTYFWNPFRNLWVDSLKTYTTLAAGTTRPAYLSRARDYTESPDLMNWTPAQPQDSTNFWTGPDVNDPPYIPGGSYPQLYNLDAVAYESVVVGLFSWFYPGPADSDPNNLPGPDLVELGVGFSRDGFEWVRPTRGSGPGPNGAFIPASNIPGTWNMGNTQSAGGDFLVVGDELWFYFSGRTAVHDDPTAKGATGLASLRRDGFYSMDAGSNPGVLTTRPVEFSGKYLFVNVNDPQGSLQISVLNPSNGAVLATSLPLTCNKTLQAVTWTNGLADLSAFAGQPVEFQFTLTNGELYAFWVSASTSGASNGYLAANGPGFTGPIDNLGAGAYPTTAASPEIYPAGGTVSSTTNITILERTLGATVHYTTDGTTPTASSTTYSGPFHLTTGAAVNAIAVAPGLGNSSVVSASFSLDNTPPLVSITAPAGNQVISATFSISASASDNSGVASVQFLVDGASVGIAMTSPYAVALQTTMFTNSTHQLTAIATDKVGNSATSAPVTFTISNVATGPTNSLIGYWSFDSAYVSGTTLFDQSGFGGNATAVSTTSVVGIVGQALQFNGSSSYVQVPSSLSTQLYDLEGDLSLSLWVQTNNSTRTEALISKYSAGGLGSGYLLRTTSAGKAEMLFGAANIAGGTDVATDVTSINDGNWHHLVAVIKMGASVTFYVDGALSSTQAIQSMAGTASSWFQMGVNPWIPFGTYFTGSMDEVRIYNRALSASDVTALFLAGSSQPPVITMQPQSTTATAGLPATFGVTAIGALNYQWQSEAPGASSFSNISGATSSSYNKGVLQLSTSGTQYRCTLTNNNGTVTTNAVALTVLPQPSGTAFVTSKVLGTIRNDYTGWVGMTIRVGTSPVTVAALGRFVAGTSTATHVVKIVQASGTDLPGASASINVATGTAGTFAYVALASPITLNANTSYYIVSQETQGGDQWYDYNTIVQTTTVAAVSSAVYGNGSSYTAPGSTGQTYGPLDFLYSVSGGNNGPPVISQQPQSTTVTANQTATFSVTAVGALSYQWQSEAPGASSFGNISGAASSSYATGALPQSASGTQYRCTVTNNNGSVTSNTVTLTVTAPASGTAFVTSKVLGTLRNNYTGWVGMTIRVGASPVTVTGVGRIVAGTSTATHVVKIVEASNGADLPGASATVNVAGATSNTFVYATLASPVTLNANTSYYIVTQETLGGDQWYDYGNSAVQTTSAATVTSAVYGTGAPYTTTGSTSQTYGPVDFLYSAASAPPSISQGPQNATVTAGQTATFSVTASGAANYQWQNEAPGATSFSNITGATSSSYTTGALPLTASGTQFQCVVTNSNGSVTTNAATLTVTAQPSGTAFVTSKILGTLRNNYTGWVGMAITVEGAPVTVKALGRIVEGISAGNHVVKIVQASNAADLPGAAVTVSVAGGAPNSFVYATLASPVTLSANTTYYVVTEETFGGDQWCDYNNTVVQSTGVAIVSSAVYGSGSSYNTPGSVGQTYGPVDFLY